MYDHDVFKRVPHKRKVPQHIEEELVSYEMLNEMRFLSLERRVKMIHERFGIVIPASSLSLIYSRNRVSYRKAKKATRISEAKEARLMRERADFAKRLISL